MITREKTAVTIDTIINAPVDKVWQLWTDPKHIVKWNYTSDDWHTPSAENDLRTGGRFTSRMESRDGSQGFDFSGRYTRVIEQRLIEYVMEDGRKAEVSFAQNGNTTRVRETFDTEQENSVEMQKSGWQAILDNFKKYVEEYNFELLHFEIKIDADAHKVYSIMTDISHYPEWASAFDPTSRFEGSWEKGSTIRFLGTDREGNVGGMLAVIRENKPDENITIEYTGIIKNSQEITAGSDTEGWSGGREIYTFIEQNGKTLLSVDVEVIPGYVSYFEETWPKALKKLKEICEKDKSSQLWQR